MPSPGTLPPCSSLEQSSFYFEYVKVPAASADEGLYKVASLAEDPTGTGWQGSEFLYLYRSGQASQIMTGLDRTAGRCAAAPITSGSGGSALTYRERVSTLRDMGDEALDVEVRTATFPSGVFVAADWIVIRSGNVLIVTDEMGNISTLDKYLTVATSAAWHAYEKGA